MTPKQKYYENLADSLIEKFGQRQIEAYYAADRDEALERACRFLTPGCSVSWGGSVTLDEIGFFDAVKASDCIVYDRNDAKTPEDKKEIYRKAAGCDFYFIGFCLQLIGVEFRNPFGVGLDFICLFGYFELYVCVFDWLFGNLVC